MPAVKARAPNRLSTTSGDPTRLVRHRSYATNTAMTMAEPAMSRKLQTGQPRARPSVSG
jgi:hypothetical protein